MRVVLDEEVAEMDEMHEEAFGEGEGFPDDAGHALAGGEVESFDMVGLSLFICGRPDAGRCPRLLDRHATGH